MDKCGFFSSLRGPAGLTGPMLVRPAKFRSLGSYNDEYTILCGVGGGDYTFPSSVQDTYIYMQVQLFVIHDPRPHH